MSRKLLFLIMVFCLLVASLPHLSAQTALSQPQARVTDKTVMWDAVEGAASYTIQDRLDSGAWTERVMTDLSYLGVSWYIAPMMKMREIRIRANPADSTLHKSSEWSASVFIDHSPATATPTDVPLGIPAAPGNLRHHGHTLHWDAAEGAVRYWVIVKGQTRRARTISEYVTGTSFEITGAMIGKQYVVQIQSQGDGVSHEEQGRFANVYFFTVEATEIPTATATATATATPTAEEGAQVAPTATATRQRSSGGGGGNGGGGGGGSKTKIKPTQPKKVDPPDDPPPVVPPICRNSRPCRASSGTWTTSFVRGKSFVLDQPESYCWGTTVTRTLQQFTCANTCPPANPSTQTRILSESTRAGRVSC